MLNLTFSSLLLFLCACTSLNAQDIKAEIGLLDEVYIFDGAIDELYNTKYILPSKVEVASTLKNSAGRYQKSHLLDNDYKTAWVEGVEGDGIGQKIRFFFEGNSVPDVISIVPGYMISEKTWYKNNRVTKFKIRILTADNSEEPNEFIAEFVITIPKDSKGNVKPNAYSVNISPAYLHNMLASDFGIIELEILEVDSKNATYEDTCISEIAFYTRGDTIIKSKNRVEEYERTKAR
ncbi:MAG: Unknown protein [uncultured Aureispira sp.]|uniref:NAD glycohydrolase translocation F5/8 type C domain-containing protein n=1 Tax=uncultured Aureispira sp. TaxID=1331704 RepID=A0A6S6TPF1_9BACT|nr:MAG: Unknown protein [uncultured Aureispira sp.]